MCECLQSLLSGPPVHQELRSALSRWAAPGFRRLGGGACRVVAEAGGDGRLAWPSLPGSGPGSDRVCRRGEYRRTQEVSNGIPGQDGFGDDCKPAPTLRSGAWLDGDRTAGRAPGRERQSGREQALPTSAQTDSSGTRSPTIGRPARPRTVAGGGGRRCGVLEGVGHGQPGSPASGAETGQTRWPPVALNGGDNAYPFTRNPCCTGISSVLGHRMTLLWSWGSGVRVPSPTPFENCPDQGLYHHDPGAGPAGSLGAGQNAVIHIP